MNLEWIAFPDKQRDASILTEEARLLLNRAQPTQPAASFLFGQRGDQICE